MVDEVQEVYRLQGVKINDKHIEIIIRQMMRKLRVKEVGDTDFLIGEQVDKVEFESANARMKAGPMTFSLGGRQYIAVAAGPNILCFGL